MRPWEPPGSSLSPGPRAPGIFSEVQVAPTSYCSASFSAAAAAAPSTPFTNDDHDDDTLMTNAEYDSQDPEREDVDEDADDEEDIDQEEEQDEDDSDVDLDDDEGMLYAQPAYHYGHQDHSYYHNPHYQHHYWFFGAHDDPSDEDMANASMPDSLGLGTYKHLGEMDAETLSSSSGEFAFSNEGTEEEASQDEGILGTTVAAPGLSLAPSPAPTSHGLPPDAFAVSAQLQQLIEVSPQHPTALTNPNPLMLGSNNLGLSDFLLNWAVQSRTHHGYPESRSQFPIPSRIHAMETPAMRVQEHIQYADLEGDACDFQGIDWQDLGITREEARERRLLTYNNYVHQQGSDRWHAHLPDKALPRLDSFFRFRRMDLKRNINLSHFQLRNILATPDQNVAYYSSSASGVHKVNLSTGKGRPGMRLRDGEGSHITTIAAQCGILAAGCFNGEYLVQNLASEAHEEWHEGLVTSENGITNHVEVYRPRSSSSPVAAFASNDLFFRILDLTTQTWLSEFQYESPINCTAVSPDGRLRVMVGDSRDVIIALAEPQHSDREATILHQLSGHRDFGFSCAWADDGITVATGFQDKAVKIWDARRWVDSKGSPNPVCTLRSEMAGVRSLRFSPVGSGQRVLVAAEEADYVNIVDARTFRSKQTIDVFGEIGGVSFSNEGQDLMVLCCDQTRGGIMQLERCGLGAEGHVDLEDLRTTRYAQHGFPAEKRSDWPRSMFTEGRRVRENEQKRRRKAARLDSLAPF